jgi:hypothetical protein
MSADPRACTQLTTRDAGCERKLAVKWTDEQRRIEGMYQRAMDLRDSTPGNLSAKDEARYTKAYIHAFKQSHDVAFFRKMTRAYRRMLRDLRASVGRVRQGAIQ